MTRVDRTRRVRTDTFAYANPDRFTVNRIDGGTYWGVWRGPDFHGAEPDFATAIAYADRTAREEAP